MAPVLAPPTSQPDTSRSDAFIAAQRASADSDAGPQEEPKEAEWQQNLNEIMVCTDCNTYPPNLVEEFSSGDMVCGDCGLVLGTRIIDTRSEWRTFANDDQNNDDPSRVGDSVNPLLNGSQLETTIAFDGKDARDLQRAQNKALKDNSNNSTLMVGYRQITSYCEAMSISKTVQDAAKHIYKMTEDAKLFRAKPLEPIIASCIFIACRQSNAPRTFREIFSLTKVPKKDIGRTFKQLEKFLQHDKNKHLHTDRTFTSSSTNATELCGRYCGNLHFSNSHLMSRVSSELCQKSYSVKDLAGRSPLSVAAACIYMTCHLMGEARSLKQIADVAGVSDGTVKTAYRFLYQARETLVEQDWITRGGSLERLPVS